MAPAPTQDSNAEVLGRNLTRLRTTSELTQVEVARRAGVARAHYAALEAGSSSNGGPANPRLSTLLSLVAALQAPVSELLDGLHASADDSTPAHTTRTQDNLRHG